MDRSDKIAQIRRSMLEATSSNEFFDLVRRTPDLNLPMSPVIRVDGERVIEARVFFKEGGEMITIQRSG